MSDLTGIVAQRSTQLQAGVDGRRSGDLSSVGQYADQEQQKLNASGIAVVGSINPIYDHSQQVISANEDTVNSVTRDSVGSARDLISKGINMQAAMTGGPMPGDASTSAAGTGNNNNLMMTPDGKMTNVGYAGDPMSANPYNSWKQVAQTLLSKSAGGAGASGQQGQYGQQGQQQAQYGQQPIAQQPAAQQPVPQAQYAQQPAAQYGQQQYQQATPQMAVPQAQSSSYYGSPSSAYGSLQGSLQTPGSTSSYPGYSAAPMAGYPSSAGYSTAGAASLPAGSYAQ